MKCSRLVTLAAGLTFAAALALAPPVHAASVFFTAVRQSAAADRGEEDSFVPALADINASLIKFTSADPTIAVFSGNNEPGVLSYQDNSTNPSTTVALNGIISRQFKSGGTVSGLYFIDSGNNFVVEAVEDGSSFAYAL